MSDNTTLLVPSSGTTTNDTIRDIDRGTAKTQVVQLDAGGESAESLVTASNPLPANVTDGTNVASVKAASTAAVAADKALVVAVSPNNTVAVTQATAANLNATVTGTVTTTPPSHASTNVDQVGGSAVTLGSKTSANSIPVVVASDQGAVPVSGTVTTTPPANASTNVAQFGGTNVSTGTGVGGAGIPRVTVSSDSFPATQPVSGTVGVNNFPATQPVSAASLPLPTNAAQETGGAIERIAALGRVQIALMIAQLAQSANQPTNGFVPLEIPAFLGAL